MILAFLGLSAIIPLIEVLAVLAIVYVIVQYLIPAPPNFKQAVLYIIGIIALVYLVIWALRFLGGIG